MMFMGSPIHALLAKYSMIEEPLPCKSTNTRCGPNGVLVVKKERREYTALRPHHPREETNHVPGILSPTLAASPAAVLPSTLFGIGWGERVPFRAA